MSELDNRSIDKETLAPDDAAVSRLLRGLQRVSAPTDFDVRLRSRIARRRVAPVRGNGFPMFARLAAAMGAVLIVAGLAGYVWLSRPAAVADPAVASTGPGVERPRIDPISNSAQATPARPVDERPTLVPPITAGPARQTPKDTGNSTLTTAPGTDAAGSETSATRAGRQIFPKGVDPNKARLAKPKEFDKLTQTPASEVLTLLGIDAKFSDGSWKVGTVKEATAAERAGVRTGDVIEALNDQVMREKTSFGGTFSVKSLRVKRDGQSIKISLTNK